MKTIIFLLAFAIQSTLSTMETTCHYSFVKGKNFIEINVKLTNEYLAIETEIAIMEKQDIQYLEKLPGYDDNTIKFDEKDDHTLLYVYLTEGRQIVNKIYYAYDYGKDDGIPLEITNNRIDGKPINELNIFFNLNRFSEGYVLYDDDKEIIGLDKDKIKELRGNQIIYDFSKHQIDETKNFTIKISENKENVIIKFIPPNERRREL